MKLRSPERTAALHAAELDAGFAKLKFPAALEKEFREYYTERNIGRARVSGLIALMLVLVVALIDLSLGPSAVSEQVNSLRLAVLCPMLVLMVATTHMRRLREHYTALVGSGALVAGIVVTFICHVSSLQGASYVLAGVVLVNLYATLFLGLLFGIALTIAVALTVAHVAFGVLVGLPAAELAYSTSMLAAAAVIGSIAAYDLERAHRRSFVETRYLNELAERDGLTGLYNRRMFDDHMRRLWGQSRRDDVPVAIIFVDIDYFKVYNDVYGHQAGDDCLKKVARTLAGDAKRPFDFCARYGGEEFVLVLYGPPPEYARSLPEQIRRSIMGLVIVHERSPVADCVTASIGVGLTHPASGRSLEGAIQIADEALYEAKMTGRNRVVVKDAADAAVETGNFRAAYREVV